MTRIVTHNPKNGELLREYGYLSPAEIRRRTELAGRAQEDWRALPLDRRLAAVRAWGELFAAEAPRLGALATEEMGKPIRQAVKEVEKCALTCRYYADQATDMLRTQSVDLGGALTAGVAFEPLGTILCVMPWNFPYWQVVRFAVPALAAGNTVLLKHAEATTGVALELERLATRAGFPPGVFQVLVVEHEQITALIEDPIVQAVSFTGSERVGRLIAAQAGAALKKSVLELGGSDAYIVLADCDLEQAAQVCVEARFVNSGQSCVAAKRFLVEAPVHDAFVEAFVELARRKVVGDPADPAVDIGPLARDDLRQGVEGQVRRSLEAGARLRCGGERPKGPGYFLQPTVLDGVCPGMAAFDEEVFGPVAAISKVRDVEEAVRLFNLSRYGLGGAIFSRDHGRAAELARTRLQAGYCAVNTMVQSDPRLPFGGVKASGYGRELGVYGLREFVNVKTLVVAQP